MIRSSKILFFVMALCSQLIIHAKTNMYFVNNTPHTVSIDYDTESNPKGAGLNDFVTGPRKVEPNQRVLLMSVPRGGMALDPSSTYNFVAVIGGLPGFDKLGIALQVQTSYSPGLFKTSTIKASAFRASSNVIWSADESRSYQYILGQQRHTVIYRWLGTGLDIYRDIEFILT